jgi:glycosyltransferase involved in cell wall biosynthesis
MTMISNKLKEVSNPLVTVIIPTYNAKKTIDQCLGAVLSALPEEKEVIVIDDCSKDETPSIVSKYPVSLFQMEKNAGPGRARNYGAKIANGKFLVLIDSDVIIEKQTIIEMLRVLEEKQAGGVAGLAFPLSHDIVSDSFGVRSLGVSSMSDRKIKVIASVGSGLTAYPIKVFREQGGYDENLRIGEDLDFNTRLTEAGFTQFLVPSAVGYHDHPSSFRGVARKWFQYGFWLFRVYLKHNQKVESLKIVGWVFGNIILLFLLFWTDNFLVAPFLVLLFFAPWIFYYGKNTFILLVKTRKARVLFMPFVHLTAIVSRTAGFIWSICNFYARRILRK